MRNNVIDSDETVRRIPVKPRPDQKKKKHLSQTRFADIIR